jgi:hypothetical protein
MFAYAVVAFVIGFILYRLYRNGPSVAALTIAVDYFQVLALFAALQVRTQWFSVTSLLSS